MKSFSELRKMIPTHSRRKVLVKTYIAPDGSIFVLNHFIQFWIEEDDGFFIFGWAIGLKDKVMLAECGSREEAEEQLDYILKCLDPQM